MQTSDKFRDYLLAALPDEYPISSIPLSFSMGRNHCNELIFQQNIFLDAAASQLVNSPALAFVATLKHQCLLDVFKLESVKFTDLADKEYFQQVQRKCEEVQARAAARLNEKTKLYCWRLIHLQQSFSMISKTVAVANNAIAQCIYSFEPPLQEPKKPDETSNVDGIGCLVTLLSGGGVAFLEYCILGSVHFLVVFIASLIGFCAVAIALKPRIEKMESAKTQFKDALSRFKEFGNFRQEFYPFCTF